MIPFTYKTQTFVIRQSEPLNSITSLSHFDLSVFALYRGFVALALVPAGTDPSALYMFLNDKPSEPMFHMPSILIWFGLVGQDIRQVHVRRSVPVADGSVLCWYFCAVAAMPQDITAWFGASVGLNFQI
jgi:hypothetical protein